MASNWSGDEVNDVQRMSEGKDDEIDRETSRAKTATLMAVSFQGDHVVRVCVVLRRHGNQTRGCKDQCFTACWMCSVGLSLAVGVPMATFEAPLCCGLRAWSP